MGWRTRPAGAALELKALLIIAAGAGAPLTPGPITTPLHGPPPLGLQRSCLIARNPGFELAVDLPEVLEIGIGPDAGAQTGQERGSQSGRLRMPRTLHRNPEQVRLELTENVHDCGAAIDTELTEGLASVLFHGLHDIPRLVRHRLDGSAHQMRLAAAAGQPHDRPTRVGVPVGGAKASEGRDQKHTARVGD